MKKSPRRNLKHYSDEQLLAMVSGRVAGWQSAFSEISGRHHGYLYRRCLQRLGQAADVEDVIQEVNFSVYRYAATFRQESTFKTWLTRIADNQCNSYSRRQEKYYVVEHLSDLIVLYEYSVCRVTHDIGSIELKDDIASLMAVLSLSQKEILFLRYWEELSVQEISQILGIGLSAVKMRIKRAIACCTEHYLNNDLKVA
ncbi:MAG: RNA polymerase sigma factor [Gammaproteobacteria bacterium]|nr:RNA polymerase sigma factor [Gammaproteobacteria bacterium]